MEAQDGVNFIPNDCKLVSAPYTCRISLPNLLIDFSRNSIFSGLLYVGPWKELVSDHNRA